MSTGWPKKTAYADEEDIFYCYRLFLKREPDEAGFAYFKSLVQGGQFPLQTLVFHFVESDEYKSLKASEFREISCQIGGIDLKAFDDYYSASSEVTIRELEADLYRVSDIDFEEGDIVVDIGAYIGLFSMVLAKKHPGITIYAFEPVSINFRNLIRGIEANGIRNVRAFQLAVTADGRKLEMLYSHSFTGGSTTLEIQKENISTAHLVEKVASKTLDQIFNEFGIDRCKLLKIDCEGSEYEILYSAKCLDRISNIRGEFHMNKTLAAKGYSIEDLVDYLSRSIPKENIYYVPSRMSD
ncbi:MAG: FkbM family methyltransferase [Clostridiales bacterium]|jgi:FkbM family methyltransferase|nr:FkbM family methyltransferase [Clostridiales bacterium]